MKLFVVLLTTLWVSNASFAGDQVTELGEVMAAYTEAKALGHKADTFLHARRAYTIATKIYSNDASKLAPHTLTYAQAAASYREPVALSLFKQSFNLYIAVHGQDDPALLIPLIDGADEAKSRKEPELAYRWYDTARDIIDQHNLNNSIESTRVQMGLAQLYLDAGELDRSLLFAHAAQAGMIQNTENMNPLLLAELYYTLAEVERAQTNNQAAQDAYKQSLQYYLEHEPHARRVQTLHKRLVEINHKLGNFDKATDHCLAYERWNNKKNWIGWGPLYDPAERLNEVNKPKTGQILAAYERHANCRVTNVIIHKTIGIDEAEAKALLEQAYISPRMKDGKLHPDQSVEQINIDVYEK